MSHIKSLTLTSFRNYQSASIDGLDNAFVILIGDNGAGKTNCLEAVSLLSPGRGLRSAGVTDMQSQDSGNPWAISALVHDDMDDVIRLGVGRDSQKPDKKIIRADGNPVKNQSDLGDILRTVWLTPQMDGLFLQGTSERRRFFDRLSATFDGSHTGRMTRYEKAMRQRLNLLKDDTKTPDPTWLDGLEQIMAETSVAIAAARLDVLNQLQIAIDRQSWDQFPQSMMDLSGDVEQSLKSHSALSVEDMIKNRLLSMRSADGQTGRTNFGIHRTDLTVTYTDKNANAAQCSTGEQKALLTGIILSHAQMVQARFGAAPILLFDEVAAHFDEIRRNALLSILSQFNTQIWVSGQDEKAFLSVNDKANVLCVKNNTLIME